MTPPDFQTLPRMEGSQTYRQVAGTFMDFEQYTAEGWYRDSRGYWVARLEGLQRYGRLIAQRREQRIAAAIHRREEDDSWSNEMANLIEERGDR
jgi:hypothetical protein